jgi:hypothetical protein
MPAVNNGFFHFDALSLDDYIQLGVIVDPSSGGVQPTLVQAEMEIERLV